MPPIRAKDPAMEAWNRYCLEQYARKGFYHSIALPDGRVIEGVIPLELLRERLGVLPLPADLSGKRVLDIGAWDGFFAFEMERRGAQVTAIDSTEIENFYVVRRLLNSSADYRVQSVYDLSLERNGAFDIVLFMGVLYHLKHPLLALERVCEVTRELAIVESFVTNEAPSGELASLQFYETNELLGQIDNWCGPNLECLLAFCRTAGFARCRLIRVKEQRAIVACYRRWEESPEPTDCPAPELLAVTHAGNYGINASWKQGDYLSAFFKSRETDLTLETVFPEAGGFGVRPVSVTRTGGDGWQANFLTPSGLAPGWHEVRLRTSRSPFSNAVRVAIEMPVEAEQLRILGASDARTGRPGEVAAEEPAVLSVWIEGLPENADRGNLKIYLGFSRLEFQDMEPYRGPEIPRRVDVKLPSQFPKGRCDLLAVLGQTRSAPLSLRVV